MMSLSDRSEMNKDKLLKTIGLAYRADKLVSGEEFSLDLIKKERATLVFLANDAGINTTKQIQDKTKFHNISLNQDLSTDELSRAIGKTNRKVICITSKAFAKLLLDAINE